MKPLFLASFICTGALAATLVPAFAAVPKAQSCLSYWQVGDSGCEGGKQEKEQEQEKAPEVEEEVPVQEPAPAPPPSLDQRVDEFLENYEKPPREFVEFNLEPTLENALKWVAKYNETLRRNSEITAAWRQAEKIYEEAAARGESLPELENALPKMPDFSEILTQYEAQKEGGDPFQPQAPVFEPSEGGISVGSQVPVAGRIGGVAQQVRVLYFTSINCADCARMEKSLSTAVASTPLNITIECINTTPAAAVNVALSCQQRPPFAGEEAAYGIQKTPSLVVEKEDWAKPQRVTGYVEAESLIKFLLEN